MGSIYVCPKCEVEVNYSELFCSCGTQLVRTDNALADDVFRKYRESKGTEVPKTDNEGKTKTSQDLVSEADTSLGAKENTNKRESVNVKNVLIQAIYFISTFWVFAGFTLSYASYVSYLSLFLITLIVYVAIYKINLKNYSASVKRTVYWMLFGGVFMLVVVMEINPFIQKSIEFIDNTYKFGSCSAGRFFSSPPKLNLTSGELVAKELYENPPKNISPIHLNSLFSDGTDLQKANAEKSITGQIVKWKLKVKNVSVYTKYSVEIITEKGSVDHRSEQWKSFYNGLDRFFKDAMNINSSYSSFGGLYDNQNVGVNIILDIESHEASYLNSLKEGDWIVVIGKIDKVIGSRVKLTPALIETPTSFALFQSANNKVQQHKLDLQKYEKGSCKFNSSGKRSEEQLQQVNIDKGNNFSLVNESNKTLPQITIKQITEYNSKCSNSNGCSWDTLFKAFPLKWEKESEGEYYEISYKAISKDFEISTGGFKKGPHGDLYISSKYVEGQKKLRKLLESSHSFEKIICRKPSAKEDARNYIYKINNNLLFIFYKIENGNEVVSYFSYEKNPYELIKTNLKDLGNMVEDNCPL